MPRIAFITASVNRGGASKVISILANHFADQGWDVDFVIKETMINGYRLNDKINVIEYGKTNENKSWRFLRALRRYFVEKRPEYVVSFLTLINLYTVIAHMGLKGKVLISERNDPVYSESKLQFNLSKILYGMSDGCVFQSKKVMGYYSTWIQNRSRVILNPVEIKCSKNDEAERKIIATAGRFVPQKNHRMLIEVFARILKDYPDYQLHIYGDGPLKEEYLELINSLGINNSVKLPGNVLNLHERLSSTQIFAISSDFEGLSNALLEAVAMGLPCVSTKSGGAGEVITNNVNGILVDIQSEDQLELALREYITNKDLRGRISVNAQKVSEKFSKEAVIGEWEDFILQ